LRPIDDALRQQNIDTLIVVPDGVLRLVPLAALHDGEQFAIAKFAIAVAPGLTMTRPSGARDEVGKVLLAGLSEPGPVVDKLREQTLRSVAPAEPVSPARRSADPSGGLALPGVVAELEALQRNTRSDRLLNQEFTVERFRQQVTSGDYRIVHVASHAVFSPRAEDSFIMAYDDVITIDALQTYLRAESLQKHPIDLLSLSACQTAEGDDRAPLGIAGAALRARAASALGSLWPVEDEATKTLMVRFYQGFSTEGLGKAKALQRAQLELLRNKRTAHPFYWAPFVLVGSWQ
jgi:CHAT domain-containing protein